MSIDNCQTTDLFQSFGTTSKLLFILHTSKENIKNSACFFDDIKEKVLPDEVLKTKRANKSKQRRTSGKNVFQEGLPQQKPTNFVLWDVYESIESTPAFRSESIEKLSWNQTNVWKNHSSMPKMKVNRSFADTKRILNMLFWWHNQEHHPPNTFWIKWTWLS